MFIMNKIIYDMIIICNFIVDYDIVYRLKLIVRCGYIVNFKICINKYSYEMYIFKRIILLILGFCYRDW